MQATPKFKGASAKDKKQFLDGKKKETPDEPTQEDVAVATEAAGEKLEGAFAIINPIPTIVGPIGEFPMEPESFPKHPAIIQYGKRRTGKSFTARWILYKCFSDYPFGICCTGTYYNGFWQKYIPPQLVFEGLNNTALTLLIQRQIALIKKFEKEHPDKDYKEEPSLRAFVVLGKQSRYDKLSRYIIVLRVFSSKELHHQLGKLRRCTLVCHRRTMPQPESLAGVCNYDCAALKLEGV